VEGRFDDVEPNYSLFLDRATGKLNIRTPQDQQQIIC